MIIKLENFSTYFAINGVPQQRGSIRLIEHDENIGMAIIGSDRNLVPAIHFSDWVDGTETPFATKQDLLDAIVIASMESNQAGITDAPADDEFYTRRNNNWVPDVLSAEFSSIILPAPISTNSQIFQPVLTHTFLPLLDAKDYEIKLDFKWDSQTAGQRTQFQVLLDGVPFDAQYTKEPKDTRDEQLVSYSFEITGLTIANHTIALEFRKQNGTTLTTIRQARISSKRIR